MKSEVDNSSGYFVTPYSPEDGMQLYSWITGKFIKFAPSLRLQHIRYLAQCQPSWQRSPRIVSLLLEGFPRDCTSYYGMITSKQPKNVAVDPG
jgi:hypothetical protein